MTHLAAKALTFHAAGSENFQDYCRKVVANARALADGLRDGGVRLVTGGTDTHQILVDLGLYGISGATAELVLDQVGIETNKNLIPYDTNSPEITSGLRLGSSGVTSRGMGEPEMVEIAKLIVRLLHDPENQEVSSQIQSQVRSLCKRFPLYLK
jgi:glycine hydroxymethyltransferase